MSQRSCSWISTPTTKQWLGEHPLRCPVLPANESPATLIPPGDQVFCNGGVPRGTGPVPRSPSPIEALGGTRPTLVVTSPQPPMGRTAAGWGSVPRLGLRPQDHSRPFDKAPCLPGDNEPMGAAPPETEQASTREEIRRGRGYPPSPVAVPSLSPPPSVVPSLNGDAPIADVPIGDVPIGDVPVEVPPRPLGAPASASRPCAVCRSPIPGTRPHNCLTCSPRCQALRKQQSPVFDKGGTAQDAPTPALAQARRPGLIDVPSIPVGIGLVEHLHYLGSHFPAGVTCELGPTSVSFLWDEPNEPVGDCLNARQPGG